MPVVAGSHNDLYAKRRAARILATTECAFAHPGDPAFLRVKLTIVSPGVLLHALGGFAPEPAVPTSLRPAWLPEDDALLRRLWASPMHRIDMARVLGRTVVSCYTRANKLNLPDRVRVLT